MMIRRTANGPSADSLSNFLAAAAKNQCLLIESFAPFAALAALVA